MPPKPTDGRTCDPQDSPDDGLGGDNEDPIVLDEIVEAALSSEQLRALWSAGLSLLDVLAGNVPGRDPVEIIIGVWKECLPEDEYARCMAQLPEMLAEYQRPGG